MGNCEICGWDGTTKITTGVFRNRDYFLCKEPYKLNREPGSRNDYIIRQRKY